MELIAAPLAYAPLAYPATVEAPYLALRPVLEPGDEPRAAVLLVEVEVQGLAD